jgi:hypothetical protein
MPRLWWLEYFPRGFDPYSIFEHFTPEEAAAGFERLEAAVAADPDALVPSYQQPLLTLTRP